ncbi:MAG TPA: protein kinase [Candidatus Acidoferrales bacterium]
MTQPSDPRGSSGSDRSASSIDSSRGSRSQQDTILLSDVPEAESIAAAARDTSSQAQPANPASLHLSSAALSALGQRYDILDTAGHGSMGNVYKARDRETGEIVALKLLKPEIASDQQMMDRFKNELLFARKITHKNICRVHEFNRLGGIAYTSMEFVEGESLRSVLNRFGAMSLRKGIDLAQQLCSGLKEAHAQGIVHRDLKPENVMIDSRGNVKIMDFGIARSMESLTRMTGAMVGTPAYMAPEQVAGKPIDYRTDIYSLGLILYEVFTGTQAFTADNAVAVAMKQLRESPVPPHEIDANIAVPIERAILKSLEKEPEKRFQSIAELEKVFASRIASGAPSSGSSTTAGRSTQEALALQPTIPVSTPLPMVHVAAQPKSSGGKWVALIIVLALLASFAAGAAKWAKYGKLADKLMAPPAPIAPKLPDFALTQPAPDAAAPISASSWPVAQTLTAATTLEPDAGNSPPSPSSPAPATTTPADTSAPAPTAVATAAVSKPKPVAPAVSVAPSGSQQRAGSALKENQPATSNQNSANAADPAQPMGSVLRGNGPSYIWVARYDREDRAQDASRKIQGLGLTSVVIPRPAEGGKHVFVVFSGPFPPARIPSVIDWLRVQGFTNVREVKIPSGEMRGRSSTPSVPNDFDGSSE